MRIAIIEDEQRLAALLKKGLASQKHSVDVFADAASAKAKLSSSGNSYELIILDLTLPDEEGSVVCDELRKNGIRTPILVLTARDSLEDKILLLNLGADDFLTKPFNLEELYARARALSRRASDSISVDTTLKDLRISPEMRQVFRGREEIFLTQKEFDLLLFLALNRGRIVGRGEIRNKVWKQDSNSETNVIDVYVRNLRKKIDVGEDKTYIQTIHGSGYTIEA